MGVERPRELETVATHREREAVSVEGRMPETSSGTGWNVFDLDGRTVEADSRRLQSSDIHCSRSSGHPWPELPPAPIHGCFSQ